MLKTGEKKCAQFKCIFKLHKEGPRNLSSELFLVIYYMHSLDLKKTVHVAGPIYVFSESNFVWHVPNQRYARNCQMFYGLFCTKNVHRHMAIDFASCRASVKMPSCRWCSRNRRIFASPPCHQICSDIKELVGVKIADGEAGISRDPLTLFQVLGFGWKSRKQKAFRLFCTSPALNFQLAIVILSDLCSLGICMDDV